MSKVNAQGYGFAVTLRKEALWVFFPERSKESN